MVIVSLSGFRNSGKNSFSFFLKEKNFVELSFASVLKDIVSILFDWDRKMLEGIDPFSRNTRKKEDVWWSNKLNIKNFSPEKALMLIGTDLFRNKFHEQIWIFSLEKKILNLMKKNVNIVITDCRFLNEINFLKSLTPNFVSVKIVRDASEPNWKNLAIKAKKGDKEALKYLQENNIHISEWDLIDYPFDWIIYNNSTMEKLRKESEKFIEYLIERKLL